MAIGTFFSQKLIKINIKVSYLVLITKTCQSNRVGDIVFLGFCLVTRRKLRPLKTLTFADSSDRAVVPYDAAYIVGEENSSRGTLRFQVGLGRVCLKVKEAVLSAVAGVSSPGGPLGTWDPGTQGEISRNGLPM